MGALGWDKGGFKVLYFTNTNILFTLTPSPWTSSYNKDFESLSKSKKLSKFKITGVFLRNI